MQLYWDILFCYWSTDLDKNILYAKEAIQFAEKNNDNLWAARFNRVITISYYRKDQFDLALQVGEKAVKYAVKAENKKEENAARLEIGNAYLPDGNGVDFCVEVHKKYPDMKILVLTSHDEYSIAKRVMANGASGYILKNSLSEEVIAGIKVVANNKVFLCEEVDILLKEHTDKPVWLSSREQELLRLIVDGYSNQGENCKLYFRQELFPSKETF